MKQRFVATICLMFFSSGGPWAQTLPVTKVVLFTSGVGYFEHSGVVNGDAMVDLILPVEQVNDALKSLILRDSAGSIGVVGYPSQDPIERSLASFSLNLSGPGGLAALLPQLRGTSIAIATPEEVTGRLVGLDSRTDQNKPEIWLTLATAEGLRVVPLASVLRLRVLDARLDQELSQALTLLGQTHDSGKKTVTAHFPGQGARKVTLGYVTAAPVWKTSYRIDLSGPKPYLQAWAIVENTGETDWNQVRLGLVSGRPVSFVQDLYTPRYIQRPVYQPESDEVTAPRLNQGGISAPSMEMASAPPPAPAPMASKSAKVASSFEDSEEGFAGLQLAQSGVRAATSGQKTGELFQFALQSPLTLARHSSALIPLAATEVTAQKVSLFNANLDSVHPQNAVWITNSTGLRLPSGPVTVYDGGSYAGDAVTDSLVENDKRLWTYATDLAVRADLTPHEEQVTTKITIVKGFLNIRKDLTWQETYHFVNLSTDPRTVLVEHPVQADRTLVAPLSYVEKTPDYYRFSVSLPAAGKADLVVKEGRTVVETQGLVGWRGDQMLALVSSNSPLSPAVKAGLKKLAEVRAAVDRAAQETAAALQQKTDLEASQGRIRENLDAVGKTSTQGQTYLKKLMDSEAQIDKASDRLDAARQAQSAVQKEWDDTLRNLTVE